MWLTVDQQRDGTLDDKTDVAVSAVLIAVTLALVIVFILMTFKNLRKLLRDFMRARNKRKHAREAAADVRNPHVPDDPLHLSFKRNGEFSRVVCGWNVFAWF